MSKHTRTSRRRRIAVGLGATGGGLLAAAFMPMGIALADPTGVPGTDPGLYPLDTETSPDAFYDFLGVTDGTNAGATLADQQLDIDNAALAAQIDYDADNGIPFSFSSLDGIPNEPAKYVDPAGSDPFYTALINTDHTAATPTEIANAESYDYALNQLLPQNEVTYLDGIAEGTNKTLETGITAAQPDPAVELVQIFDPDAVNPATGAPNDIFGEFATLDDQFLNAFGLGAPLEEFIGQFEGTGLEMAGPLGGLGDSFSGLFDGLGGTGTELASGVGSTGADAVANAVLDSVAGIL